jgi:general secretion pathway protein G
MNRRGFTFIEILIVMIIIGILANIMIPSLGLLRRRAEAVRVIGDIESVENAVLTRYVDVSDFPASAGWGTVPDGLQNYLPAGFSFDYDLSAYRWWNTEAFVGIEARPFNQEIVGMLYRYYRGRAFPGPDGGETSIVFVFDE